MQYKLHLEYLESDGQFFTHSRSLEELLYDVLGRFRTDTLLQCLIITKWSLRTLNEPGLAPVVFPQLFLLGLLVILS